LSDTVTFYVVVDGYTFKRFYCILECDEASQTRELEEEVSDMVAWANRIQKDKKRKHGIRPGPSTSSSGANKSTTSVSLLSDHDGGW
jgi:hypothetical protein